MDISSNLRRRGGNRALFDGGRYFYFGGSWRCVTTEAARPSPQRNWVTSENRRSIVHSSDSRSVASLWSGGCLSSARTNHASRHANQTYCPTRRSNNTIACRRSYFGSVNRRNPSSLVCRPNCATSSSKNPYSPFTYKRSWTARTRSASPTTQSVTSRRTSSSTSVRATWSDDESICVSKTYLCKTSFSPHFLSHGFTKSYFGSYFRSSANSDIYLRSRTSMSINRSEWRTRSMSVVFRWWQV